MKILPLKRVPPIPLPLLLTTKEQEPLTFPLHLKKALAPLWELNTLSITVQEPSLAFSTGSFEKQPARALFKAARKGKKKLVSMVVAAKDVTNLQGGCPKPP
jgi:hypothetical protein